MRFLVLKKACVSEFPDTQALNSSNEIFAEFQLEENNALMTMHHTINHGTILHNETAECLQ
jgi:hypothetical protein